MINAFAERIRGLASLFWREVAKFGVVGGVAFVIDSGIFLWMMSGPMQGSHVKSKVVAGIVATIFSWVANRYWTFRHRRRASAVRELALFVIMNGIGLGIAAACVWFTNYVLGLNDQTSSFVAGSIVGLVLGTIFRFFAYRFWVFRKELDEEPAFAHDGELIEHHRTGQQATAAQPAAPEGPAGASDPLPVRPTE